MVKEVSDKIIVILLFVAILVSVFGTFLVYQKSTEIQSGAVIAQNIASVTPDKPSTEASVGLVVLPNEKR